MLNFCQDKSITITSKGIVLSREQTETCQKLAVMGATTVDHKLEVELFEEYYLKTLVELTKKHEREKAI